MLCELIAAYLLLKELGRRFTLSDVPIYDAHIQPEFLESHHMPECRTQDRNGATCLGCWAR